MSMGWMRAARTLLRASRAYPARHRLHIALRFLSCPFTRTIDDVPAGARVLEIGAGHGVYACLVAEERASVVVAVDPDLRKSLLPPLSPKIRKVAGFDDCIRGTFDAVAIYDVVYRIPLADRPAFFARMFDRLAPGGTLVYKEMDPSHRLKTAWTQAQEWLAEKVLHLTIGSGFAVQTREEVIAMLTAAGFTDIRPRAIDRGYPHSHVVYVARRAAP